MDLKQLEYIVTIAEKGSISKAAEALFISQSGSVSYTHLIFFQIFAANSRSSF